MEVGNIFYIGIRQQIRRVLNALGPERTDLGLTAFEDGQSNWHQCFFARALQHDEVFKQHRNERGVALALGLVYAGGAPNLIPVRIVYYTFDGNSKLITREELNEFIVAVRDGQRPEEVMRVLRSVNYDGVESKPVQGLFAEACRT